jgi:hypothetical protein
MRKIYFASTPWASSEQILEDYRHQTPNAKGVWEDIVAVRDPKQAEFIVIQDEIDNNLLLNMFKPENRLYFNREALSLHLKDQYPTSQFKRFSFWDGTGYLPIRWWYGTNVQASAQGYSGIAKTYDQLIATKPYPKTKHITSIVSNKVMNEGHQLRKLFTKQFLKQYSRLDLYGSIEFHNKTIPNNDKMQALQDYKYCLGFDNQDFIKDFFGTQLSDSLLCWCVPIFWCGTDLSRYFPEGSFIQFDARKPATEIPRIIELIENDDYEKRISAIEEARDLILNKYNFWPTIKSVIDKG